MSELEQALKALEVPRTECHNGGHHDGAPQRARSRAEKEEEGVTWAGWTQWRAA
jgi:hypothetical protein